VVDEKDGREGDDWWRGATTWAGIGRAGSEGERKGVAGYCEGEGRWRLADGRWGGEGMDAAEGWLGCWMGGVGGDPAWQVEEVDSCCMLCMYSGLGIDSAMSGKQ
jgi:hypothetical protein